MKLKRLISIIAIALVVTTSVVVYATVVHQTQPVSAGTPVAQVDENGIYQFTIPEQDMSQPVGTEHNPFVFLEIVPYEGMAEWGYLMGKGQEPVDVSNPNIMKDVYGDMIAHGYYERINGTEKEEWLRLCTELGVSDYYEIPYSSDILVPTNRFLRFTIGLQYVNNDIVRGVEDKEENIRRKIADFHIKVLTVTPADLNNSKNNQKLIDRANLISMVGKSHIGNLVEKWNVHKNTNLFPKSAYGDIWTGKNLTFSDAGCDISWEVALKILKKVSIAEDDVPLVYDITSYTGLKGGKSVSFTKKTYTKWNGETTYQYDGTGYENNIFKLFLLTQQMEPAVMYYGYVACECGADGGEDCTCASGVIRSVPKRDGSGITTGSFTKLSGDAATYWTTATLLPEEMIQESDMEGMDQLPMWDPNFLYETYGFIENIHSTGFSNVLARQNVYSFNGDNSMTGQFLDETIEYNEMRSAAFDYYESIGAPQEKLSTATVLYFLLRTSGSGSDDRPEPERLYSNKVRVLELEPAEQWYSDYELYWLLARYLGSLTGGIDVTRMTVDEFNASKLLLGAQFDLVLVGTDAYKLDNYNQQGSYVYGNSGDSASVGALGDVQYSGNDLSAYSAERLLAFADGGHPVLFGDGFYKTSGGSLAVNNERIDTASRMYAFGDAMKAHTQTYYTGAETNQKEAGERLAAALKNVYCAVTFTETPAAYTYQFDADEDGSLDATTYLGGYLGFKFRIADSVTDASYTVALLYDKEGNGGYETTVEGFELYRVNGATSERITDARALKAKQTYELRVSAPAETGAVNWELLISRTGAEDVCAAKTGISAVSAAGDAAKKQSIAVLQLLGEGTGNTLYLPTREEWEADTYHGLGGAAASTSRKLGDLLYNLPNISFTVKTVTEAELGAELSMLKQYDVVVLGASEAYELRDAAVLEALLKFQEDGKGVVFTHGTISSDASQLPTARVRLLLGMDRYGITAGLDDAARFASYDSVFAAGAARKQENVRKAYQKGYVNSLIRLEAAAVTDRNTTTAAKQNSGQLTTYPYTLGKAVSLAETEGAVYQLNLNDADLTVWYTLTGGAYEDAPMDGRNNYYMYTYGTAAYIGIGASKTPTEEELKLLVNTIVGVYRPSPKSIEIEVTNPEKSTSNNKDYIYVDFNSSDASTAVGEGIQTDGSVQTKKITYKPLLDGAPPTEITVRYYAVVDAGTSGAIPLTDPATGEHYYVKELTLHGAPLVTMPTGVEGTVTTNDSGETVITANGEYAIQVPIEMPYENSKSMEIIIGVTVTYPSGSSESYKPITLLRRSLFDLD